MLYHAYELTHAALAPMKALCKAEKALTDSGLNPWAGTAPGRALHAAFQIFDGVTRRYGRPEWGIDAVEVGGAPVDVKPAVQLCTTFCDLVHFEKDPAIVPPGDQPKTLIVVPLSGHYPTLLRGTVAAMLPDHDVYVTDWRDARDVPAALGGFDLDDFIDTVIDAIRFLGPDTHVIAVCQPSVPVLAAVALMAAESDPCQPASMTLMGGPMDARIDPTPANRMAAEHDMAWYENTVISRVPWPHPGALRPVYPGFIQLSGFLFKNLERHIDAQLTYFNHLVQGDGDSAEQHRAFYEEFLAVMDLPAEFFLQTVETVFQRFELPSGTMTHRGRPVDPSAIRHTALLTVEGGRDDICPPGQTVAAHDLCRNIPKSRQDNFLHPDVGHYGVFNGRRWRQDIQPHIAAFIAANSSIL